MNLKQNNSWLFGFADLAFLLLISLSVIPTASEEPPVHLSLMEVPGVPANPNLRPLKTADELWELHVYDENLDAEEKLFKLIGRALKQTGSATLYEKYLAKNELLRELQRLKGRNIQPVLIPSQKSLSHDFLFAAGAIAKTWGSDLGAAIVKPLNPRGEVQE
jgi:hypothetical protein